MSSADRITNRQRMFLEIANRPVTSKFYQGTVGVPSIHMDDRSTPALHRRGLIEPKTQTWTTPAGQKLTAVFWLITEAGKQTLTESASVETKGGGVNGRG